LTLIIFSAIIIPINKIIGGIIMKQYISQYKQYLIDQAKSNNTIKTYVSDLEQYFKIFDKIDRDSVQQYKKYMKEKLDLSSVSVNRKLSSLKSYNEFLLSMELIPSIYILKKDFIKIQERGNPTDVTEKQVNMFLKRVNDKPNMYRIRNIAIIYLIANTGIRREEITNLKLKNLDLENGELIVIGKGNKERNILLNDKAIEVIKNWLIDRNNFKHAKESPYIFVSERNEKLHKDTINDIFDFYSTPKCKVKPHSLRHAYSSSMIENNVLTLPELQNQLGHSNISVTSRYLHARKDNIKKKINKFNIG
jgi:integrase/recombinase XerD